MRYCGRCVYPENAKPYIIFDEEGICSGCRVSEAYDKVDWGARGEMFRGLLNEYKEKAREKRNPYDCIIPVGGGKDSHFQVHLIKNVYGLNPLLVTYNHVFNSPLGIRNLQNMVKKFGCDIIRFTSSPESIRKLSRYMLKKCGDLTWHYHSGILTFPFQIAVKYDIPLIVWAENNYSTLVGTFNPDDMMEFSRKHRKDFGLRGLEAEDAIKDPDSDVTLQDIAPFRYPSDEEIDRVGVRGIYVSNYLRWDEKEQAELVIEKYGFQPAKGPRDRTFNLYAKLEDCHANGAHDYLKYLKFGYGRATDDASMMIREGRLTREEGIEYVRQYDANRPRDLDIWLRFVDMTEKDFLKFVEPLRDTSIWEQNGQGEWRVKDSVVNHINDSGVEDARLSLRKGQCEFKEGPYDVYDPRCLLDFDGYVIL